VCLLRREIFDFNLLRSRLRSCSPLAPVLIINCFTTTSRFIGNYENILKWSSRNKKKLREPAEYPISARESFDSWNKVIDSGTIRQARLKLGDSQEEDEDEEDNEEDEEEEEEEEESDEDDEDEIQEKKRNKKEESSSSERAKAHNSYSSEVVTEGEKRPVKIDYSFMGSTGTASGSMGNDGMVVRQPSIVRDLWAQVSHSVTHTHTHTQSQT
jgi:hypothetical protein